MVVSVAVPVEVLVEREETTEEIAVAVAEAAAVEGIVL